MDQKRIEIKMDIKKYPIADLLKLNGFYFDKTLMSNPLIYILDDFSLNKIMEQHWLLFFKNNPLKQYILAFPWYYLTKWLNNK